MVATTEYIGGEYNHFIYTNVSGQHYEVINNKSTAITSGRADELLFGSTGSITNYGQYNATSSSSSSSSSKVPREYWGTSSLKYGEVDYNGNVVVAPASKPYDPGTDSLSQKQTSSAPAAPPASPPAEKNNPWAYQPKSPDIPAFKDIVITPKSPEPPVILNDKLFSGTSGGTLYQDGAPIASVNTNTPVITSNVNDGTKVNLLIYGVGETPKTQSFETAPVITTNTVNGVTTIGTTTTKGEVYVKGGLYSDTAIVTTPVVDEKRNEFINNTLNSNLSTLALGLTDITLIPSEMITKISGSLQGKSDNEIYLDVKKLQAPVAGRLYDTYEKDTSLGGFITNFTPSSTLGNVAVGYASGAALGAAIGIAAAPVSKAVTAVAPKFTAAITPYVAPALKVGGAALVVGVEAVNTMERSAAGQTNEQLLGGIVADAALFKAMDLGMKGTYSNIKSNEVGKNYQSSTTMADEISANYKTMGIVEPKSSVILEKQTPIGTQSILDDSGKIITPRESEILVQRTGIASTSKSSYTSLSGKKVNIIGNDYSEVTSKNILGPPVPDNTLVMTRGQFSVLKEGNVKVGEGPFTSYKVKDTTGKFYSEQITTGDMTYSAMKYKVGNEKATISLGVATTKDVGGVKYGKSLSLHQSPTGGKSVYVGAYKEPITQRYTQPGYNAKERAQAPKIGNYITESDKLVTLKSKPMKPYTEFNKIDDTTKGPISEVPTKSGTVTLTDDLTSSLSKTESVQRNAIAPTSNQLSLFKEAASKAASKEISPFKMTLSTIGVASTSQARADSIVSTRFSGAQTQYKTNQMYQPSFTETQTRFMPPSTVYDNYGITNTSPGKTNVVTVTSEKTLPYSDSLTKTTEKTMPLYLTDSLTKTTSLTDSLTRLSEKTVTSTMLKTTTKTNTQTTPLTSPYGLPSLKIKKAPFALFGSEGGGGAFRKNKQGVNAIKISHSYSPDFTSAVYSIAGKASKQKTFTGLELRPIAKSKR